MYIYSATLRIDDEEYNINPLLSYEPPTMLLVGGVPDETNVNVVVGENLRGCVRNIQYNER